MRSKDRITAPHSLAGPAVTSLPVPSYLQEIYWWAYVHPWAVRVFERDWLVNLILLGNYARLRDAALAEMTSRAGSRTLQVACVYGDLTVRLHEQLAQDATLDVVDVMPIQLRNLQRKLPHDAKARLLHLDSTALGVADATYDEVLLFFLLHEQPLGVRRRTVAEAVRVVKPGGKIVLVDYHRPHDWHPLRPLMRTVLKRLEPFALDLWETELETYVPHDVTLASVNKKTYFGGLYQKVVLTR
ncbi:MAG: methyltransferase domain-containing protein [Betaproteobacteria bacterium]|nr:MAG: methyltransferase domain-containing protein [Betaproteobacteria bacterium]